MNSPRILLKKFSWGQLNKKRSSRKVDSRVLFSRELDFQKSFSLTENKFSRETYFYTIRPRQSKNKRYKLIHFAVIVGRVDSEYRVFDVPWFTRVVSKYFTPYFSLTSLNIKGSAVEHMAMPTFKKNLDTKFFCEAE